MKKRYEILGLKIELAGLAVLLLATFWQAEMSGWWDKESPEWQYFIQEEVNLEILRSLSDISRLAAMEDVDARKTKAYETSQRAKEKIFKAIRMRDERKRALDGLASLFSKIGLVLALFGAFLLVLGKYLSIRAANLGD